MSKKDFLVHVIKRSTSRAVFQRVDGELRGWDIFKVEIDYGEGGIIDEVSIFYRLSKPTER